MEEGKWDRGGQREKLIREPEEYVTVERVRDLQRRHVGLSH